MLEEYKDFFMAMLAILGIFIPPLVSIITEKIKNPQISYRVPIILLISVCSLLGGIPRWAATCSENGRGMEEGL